MQNENPEVRGLMLRYILRRLASVWGLLLRLFGGIKYPFFPDCDDPWRFVDRFVDRVERESGRSRAGKGRSLGIYKTR